jgi:hypothetical protein
MNEITTAVELQKRIDKIANEKTMIERAIAHNRAAACGLHDEIEKIAKRIRSIERFMKRHEISEAEFKTEHYQTLWAIAHPEFTGDE